MTRKQATLAEFEDVDVDADEAAEGTEAAASADLTGAEVEELDRLTEAVARLTECVEQIVTQQRSSPGAGDLDASAEPADHVGREFQ